MAYNLLYGAGVDRVWDTALPLEFTGRNRLGDILSVVRKIDPQILGIQEANSWDRGTPKVIQQVATELGMQSYLARAPSGFHLGILTSYQIVETENYSSEVGKQGALRATLVTPDGERLNVFVAHLDPNSPQIRMCEVNSLLRLMQPHVRRRSILIGDMNFGPTSPEFTRLAQAGWKSVAVEPTRGIDQIWIYPSVAWTSPSQFQTLAVASAISDHYPVAAQLELASPIRESSTLAPNAPLVQTPSPPPTPSLPPSVLSDYLRGVQVVRRENFLDACVSAKWISRWVTEKISNGRLEIEGEEKWQAFAKRYKEFAPGEGVLARFRFAPGSEFELYLESENLDSATYRRYGINVRDRALESITWENRTRRGEGWGDGSRLNTVNPYYLLLGVGQSGEVLVQVWDSEDPARIFRLRQRMDALVVPPAWVFQIAANRGTVWVDQFAEIAFSDFK